MGRVVFSENVGGIVFHISVLLEEHCDHYRVSAFSVELEPTTNREYENVDLEFFEYLRKAFPSTSSAYDVLDSDWSRKIGYASLAPTKAPDAFVGLIKRDVDRTFPYRSLFCRHQDLQWSVGQQSLFRLLTYVALKTKLGYCQGMNFIAGVLLEIFDGNEQIALRCFNALLARPDIGPLFHNSLILAQAYCAYLDFLVTRYLPNLAQHFAMLRLNALTYGLQWIITLLAYDMPLPALVIIWDQLTLSGPRILFQVILGLLAESQEVLLNSSFENCLKLLKGLTATAEITVDDLVSYANCFYVPRDISCEAQRALTYQTTESLQDEYHGNRNMSYCVVEPNSSYEGRPSAQFFFRLFSSCAEVP